MTAGPGASDARGAAPLVPTAGTGEAEDSAVAPWPHLNAPVLFH